MSQWRWTFYDSHGGTQTLGLYHGKESGHVTIYLNEQVVIIDFTAHHSKSYSIVVNDLLVKLNLNESDGMFSYGFEGKYTPTVGVFDRFRNLFARV